MNVSFVSVILQCSEYHRLYSIRWLNDRLLGKALEVSGHGLSKVLSWHLPEAEVDLNWCLVCSFFLIILMMG